MKNTSKRLLALILAALMLSPMTACSEQTQHETDAPETSAQIAPAAETESEETETEPAETEPPTEIELRQTIDDGLPDQTFNGRSFRVLTSEGGIEGQESARYEILADEMTGDTLNDAVYNRNLRIEDRFDIDITCATEQKVYLYLNTFTSAGSDEYDLVGLSNYLAQYSINAGSYLNWNDAAYVDLTKPWHNQLANDAATLYGTIYTLCSDLAISSMTYTYGIFFNTVLTENYGYPSDSLYGMVNDGTWTIDQFIKITDSIYSDTNGNGDKDPEDTFGFGYQINNPADVWLAAFDQPITQVNTEGGVDITFLTDKTVSILEKLLEWHYNSEGFCIYPTQYDEEKYFTAGQMAFAPLRFRSAYSTLREMEDTYSILPYPKWDESQLQYLTNADDKFTVFGIPKTIYNEMDFVSMIYEALCAESYKTVYPEYYDTALKGRYSSEPETAVMVDTIMAGRDFDFSFAFSRTFNSLCYAIRDHLSANNPNISSYYNKMRKSLEKNAAKELKAVYQTEETAE